MTSPLRTPYRKVLGGPNALRLSVSQSPLLPVGGSCPLPGDCRRWIFWIFHGQQSAGQQVSLLSVSGEHYCIFTNTSFQVPVPGGAPRRRSMISRNSQPADPGWKAECESLILANEVFHRHPLAPQPPPAVGYQSPIFVEQTQSAPHLSSREEAR